MRKGTTRALLLAWMLAASWAQGNKDSTPELLARWHFSGMDQVRTLSDLGPLQKVLNLPETAALREAALAKFSQQAAARFSPGSTNAQPELAAEVQKILPDLIRYETRFLMKGASGSDVDWLLAAKLPGDRATEWRTTLREIARGAGLKVSEGNDWTATHENYRLAFSQENGWTVLRGGNSAATADARILQDFRQSLEQGLDGCILAAEFDFPKLGQLRKSERLGHAPRVLLTLAPNRDGIRSKVDLEYPRDLGIKPEQWNVPTGLIRDPLIGFTAMQGVRETLQGSPRFRALEARKTPNQVFSWAIDESPFSTFFTAEVGNPGTVVSNLLEKSLPEIVKLPSLAAGQPYAARITNGFVLRGLPVVLPFVEAGSGNFSKFLLAGLFRVATQTNNEAAPDQLFDQLKKKNLIYYDWEITEGRIKQWHPIWQLSQILTSTKPLQTDSPSEKWLTTAASSLGNTITEATLESERRISVVRQSHIGFNALEVVLLSHWLDPYDFAKKASGPARPAAPRPLKTPPAQSP